MKILIDLTHPAHVHFFKFAAEIWQSHGHDVLFVARDKEITLQLLGEYGIPYQKLSKIRRGLLGLSIELIEHQAGLIKAAKHFQPDVMLNVGGTFIVPAGKILNIKTCVFTDTEHARLANKLTFPFATWICTPQSFTEDLGTKQVRYDGYQELAYLHPDYFSPDPKILEENGLGITDPFFILRFVSWGAAHDVGQNGLSDTTKLTLVRKLKTLGRVIITSEMKLPLELEPFKMNISPVKIHDLLYYARLYIGEGATMATEAAILGTPSVYMNPLSSGNLEEIINKYHLMYHLKNGESDIEKIFKLVHGKNLKQEHQTRRLQMLAEKVDVTSWMVDFIESLA